MTRRRFLTFLFVLLVGFGLWALLRKKPESPTPSTPVEAQNQPPQSPHQASPGIPQAPPVAPALPRSRSQPSSTVVVEGVPVSEDVIRYIQSVKADPLYDWKQPINFFGKAVDENNQSVAGAGVDYTWSTTSTNGTLTKHGVTDGSGVFEIHETGKGISITVSKEGYYTTPSERLRSYEYANPGDGVFIPEPANPVVFHLLKKGEAAQLIHGLKLFGSRVDGTLSYVDLTTAKAVLTPAGDLTVQCTRSERNADKKFDWAFTLGVPGGGLIESTNEFMFSAPDGGYQASFQINHRINDPDWTGQEKHRFFVRSQDGRHYARMVVTIMPDYNQNAAYDVEWYLNPNGSPNLESAPDKTSNVQ
jgi:hypothetical protein